ncbi:c-type cytochrome [Paenibacillus kobensis]|uniref:c-type cytochrome n=1 Tax=Paenibacillus kobensis TaxID=59841 RepID=UPI000FDB6993|nr:cytochrome c [Paenibacillus kobensis]
MFTARLLPLVALAAVAVLAGCGSSSGNAGQASKAIDGPADTVALYKAKCISCHAADLSGKVGPESDLRTVGARMTKEEIIHQITEGGDIMPPFKDRLSTAEIEALGNWLAARQ